MTDRVDSRIPESLLLPIFTYRHRQLADDLAAHARASNQGARAQAIAISGSSGLVGSALSAFLTTGGHRVIKLVRRAPHGPNERRWDPHAPAADLLAGVDAVVHLAGASIQGRFTLAHRRVIRDSRIEPTRRLAELAARTRGGPRTFISASAIGYYGPDRNDTLLTEGAERGSGFLADVVADWEAATDPAREAGMRVIRVRTGIVQSPRGGILRILYPLFAAGLGGRLGDGQQWMSWIGIDDLVDIYHRALTDARLYGPINAVSPHPVRNNEYSTILAGVLHRPSAIPVPNIAPRIALGREGADELAAASQRVAPTTLLRLEHRFRHPDLEMTLRHNLGRATGR